MKNFALSSLMIFLAFALPARAEDADCSKWLKVFLVVNTRIGDEIRPKVETSPIIDFSNDMTYQGIYLLNLPGHGQPRLEIEFRPDKGGGKGVVKSFTRLAPVPANFGYQYFADFVPNKFFVFSQSGTYLARLKVADQVLCSEAHLYTVGD